MFLKARFEAGEDARTLTLTQYIASGAGAGAGAGGGGHGSSRRPRNGLKKSQQAIQSVLSQLGAMNSHDLLDVVMAKVGWRCMWRRC